MYVSLLVSYFYLCNAKHADVDGRRAAISGILKVAFHMNVPKHMHTKVF